MSAAVFQGAGQSAGPRWYVVVTHAGQERLARMNLVRQGFDVYLPMRPPLTANPKAGAKPLFPRYMFVSVDLDRPGCEWRALYSTIGVHDVLSVGAGEARKPRAIPSHWIDSIQAREVDGLVILKPKPESRFKAGEPCVVEIGERGGALEAVFLEPVDAKRVALLISLLGSDSRHVVPSASVKRGGVR